MLTPKRMLRLMKEKKGQARKEKSLAKYMRLFALQPGIAPRQVHIERSLMESPAATAADLKHMLGSMEDLLRRAAFSRHPRLSEGERAEFVSVSGEPLLDDSAERFMAGGDRECLRHIMWAAEHSSERKLRASALARLTLIVQNLNHGICPEGKTMLDMDEPVDGIKKAMFRIFDNEFFLKSTYSKKLANTPPDRPALQSAACGLSKAAALAGIAGALASHGSEGAIPFLGIALAGVLGGFLASRALSGSRALEKTLLSLEFRRELARMESR